MLIVLPPGYLLFLVFQNYRYAVTVAKGPGVLLPVHLLRRKEWQNGDLTATSGLPMMHKLHSLLGSSFLDSNLRISGAFTTFEGRKLGRIDALIN